MHLPRFWQRVDPSARVALFYGLFAGIWILISDQILQVLVRDPDWLTRLQTLKGWAFVFTSALVIYLLLKHEFQRRSRAERSSRAWADVFHHTMTGIAIGGPDGVRLQVVNPAFAHMHGYSVEELTGSPIADVFAVEDRDMLRHHIRVAHEKGHHHFEAYHQRKDGSKFPVYIDLTTIKNAQGEILYRVATVQDITERKQAEEYIRTQLERMAALRKIDMTITSTLDLRVTFEVLLDQLVTTLKLDAADVLLFNQELQRLEYVAGRGFMTGMAQGASIPMGQGFAGKTAAQMNILVVPSILDSDEKFFRQEMVLQEEFIAYQGIPLIAKGELKGILEIFHRSPIPENPDWYDFINAISIQAAIAIDNMKLYEDLQRYTQELSMAYDATLAGWSRALELRDQETDGHSQRVTDLVVKLGRKMGLRDSDLTNLRRGTLLHDIGKMGVPDHILLKPGPLSPDEWATMRRHPLYAFEMLSPITFLRPALDIPYSHHERWDGSGYPRGLKGEEIPLAARIFAVVDVWDALCSDRPYRPAWNIQRVRQYLQERAGKHFDPRVVDEFLGMMPEK